MRQDYTHSKKFPQNQHTQAITSIERHLILNWCYTFVYIRGGNFLHDPSTRDEYDTNLAGYGQPDTGYKWVILFNMIIFG